MTAFDTDVAGRFGPDATAEQAYDLLTIDVPAASWTDALSTARDELGCTYFDWLSAVDERDTGFRVCAHLVALGGGPGEQGVRRLLLRTTVPHAQPVLASAVEVYAGAAWHERETHEMFGVDFTGHPHLVPLLLPEGFEGHPLRKDFVLAARVAKAWPGAKEPGESDHGGPKRRQMLPPGVPDPNEWGPLKGQLPPAPARPARTPRAAGERPPRRTRSVSEGSASQAGATPADAATPAGPAAPGGAGAPARRSRSVSEGSASQRPGPTEGAPPGTARPRRSRSAADGSASQSPDTVAKPASTPPRTHGTDAPWHHARPAFDDAEPSEGSRTTRPDAGTKPEDPGAAGTVTAEPGATPEPEAGATPEDGSARTAAAPARPGADGAEPAAKPEPEQPDVAGPGPEGEAGHGPAEPVPMHGEPSEAGSAPEPQTQDEDPPVRSGTEPDDEDEPAPDSAPEAQAGTAAEPGPAPGPPADPGAATGPGRGPAPEATTTDAPWTTTPGSRAGSTEGSGSSPDDATGGDRA
ncbi:NADH-quinone oxidoreductase subunit C [Streptomyces sp. NPDC059175]|uniref:NADH-quinone oxidoreductase subunit C n=1 Tax=Streptomyces sp. NPDC059175 TaxID=3346757 RepID=UPI0036B29BEE